MELAPFLVNGNGYTEAQVALVVLGIVVVAVALLSYFVVAPEYEKRLEQQYAMMTQESTEYHHHDQYFTVPKHHVKATYAKKVRKYRSLPSWDIEAASSDDDAFDYSRHRYHSITSTSFTAISDDMWTGMNGKTSPTTRAKLLERRRKSESDALKEANINKADMLRRRVLLRKLEEEIEGAMKADASNGQAGSTSCRGGAGNGRLRTRRISNNALQYSEEKLKMLQDHPADCAKELTVLSQTQDIQVVKEALQTVHDVLSFYLSVDHRDMNKVTVFCNSLLKYDGLNYLRAFEVSVDEDIRTLATSIIEKAVPAIWH